MQVLQTDILLSGKNIVIRKIGVRERLGIAVLLLDSQIQKLYGALILLFHIKVFGPFYDIHEILHGFFYRIHVILPCCCSLYSHYTINAV